MTTKKVKEIEEESEEQIREDDLFAQIAELDSDENFVSVFRILENSKEYCGKMFPPIGLDDIKEKFGGGRYRLKVYNVIPGKGSRALYGFDVRIAGEPIYEELETEQSGAGVDIEAIMAGIRELTSGGQEANRTGYETWVTQMKSMQEQTAASTRDQFNMIMAMNDQGRANDREFYAAMLKANSNQNNDSGNGIADLIQLFGVLNNEQNAPPALAVVNSIFDRVGGAISGMLEAQPGLAQLILTKLTSVPDEKPDTKTGKAGVAPTNPVAPAPTNSGKVQQLSRKSAGNAATGKPGGAKS